MAQASISPALRFAKTSSAKNRGTHLIDAVNNSGWATRLLDITLQYEQMSPATAIPPLM